MSLYTLKHYLLPFLLFVLAVFLLCYHFRQERSRLYLFVLFIVGCFARLLV